MIHCNILPDKDKYMCIHLTHGHLFVSASAICTHLNTWRGCLKPMRIELLAQTAGIFSGEILGRWVLCQLEGSLLESPCRINLAVWLEQRERAGASFLQDVGLASDRVHSRLTLGGCHPLSLGARGLAAAPCLIVQISTETRCDAGRRVRLVVELHLLGLRCGGHLGARVISSAREVLFRLIGV